jgi:hypothetical protein
VRIGMLFLPQLTKKETRPQLCSHDPLQRPCTTASCAPVTPQLSSLLITAVCPTKVHRAATCALQYHFPALRITGVGFRPCADHAPLPIPALAAASSNTARSHYTDRYVSRLATCTPRVHSPR